MRRIKNPNHPRKESVILVEPIRELEKIREIKEMLSDHPRNYALFTVGINTAFRPLDLVTLTVKTSRRADTKYPLTVREHKTKKIRWLKFNEECQKAFRLLLASRDYQPEDYIFYSQRRRIDKKTNKEVNHVSTIYLNQLVKKWTKAVGLEGNYGAHTLRKTWGYHQRVTFKTDIPTLMVCFNHSTQRQTLDYLCIQEKEIEDAFNHCL